MTLNTSTKSSNNKNGKHKYRRFFSQFIATTVKNILFFLCGLTYSIPMIIIPALTGIRNEYNQNETLTMSSEQASWFGSIGFLLNLFGCFLSGIVTDPLGRKRSMMVLNIPFFIGWYTLYQATAVWHLFFGVALQCLTMGMIEAPVVTYLGEICEPKFRGILVGYSYICSSIGMFLIFWFNTFMPWRTLCLVCSSLPIISIITLCFIPETPHWLLSKNRNAEAENSLRWLRGWVSKDAISEEFNNLQQHSERSKSCNMCLKQDLKCTHPLPTLREKLTEFKRRRTLKPLFIIIPMFFICQFSGILAMKPFMAQILKAYNSPIQPDKAMTIMSILDNAGTFSLMLVVRFTGKRRLYLFSLSSIVICAAIITWYGFTYLPSGYISFDQANHKPFEMENKVLTYIPMIFLMLWSYFAFLGLICIPWTLLSEVFPFKSRGIANGIAASMNALFGFISNKIYYNLETTLSLPGVTLLYGSIVIIGTIIAYNILPETENKSLEDIELHFSDNSKGFNHRKIISTKRHIKLEHIESGKENEIKSLI